MSKNLAIIGSGNIAPFHIEAAKNAGFNITSIAASTNSESARILSVKYEIPNYFSNVNDLLMDNSFDCLSIMIPPAATEEILSRIATINKPTIIEKPTALSSIFLENFIDNKNIIVGFNRRFYKSISELKSEASKHEGIYSFEAVESLEPNGNIYESIENTLVNNTIHMVDLIKYLIGDYELREFVFSEINYMLRSRIYANNSYKGELRISFGSKKNTKIEFETVHNNLILKPLENLQRFNAMKITEPSRNIPVRTYLPTWTDVEIKHEVFETGTLKPGFADQYVEFMGFCEKGIISLRMATLDDVHSALRKCELLVNQYVSNLNAIN
jgi:hypothetical protein